MQFQSLNVGRNRIYELAHSHHIPTIRLGKSYLFPRRALLTWIENEVARQGEIK